MAQQPNARVLIVDDDPLVNKQLQELLEPLFVIDIVQGYGHTLITNAVERAKHFRPHIAIVDLSLEPANKSDRGGLKILEQLKQLSSAHCILYSAYVTPEISRLAKEYGAEAIGKEEPPQRLIDTVTKEAQECCATLSDILLCRIPAPISAEIIKVIGLPESAPIDMADDVLIQLFSKGEYLGTKKITFRKMEEASATPGSISRGHSLVLKVWRDEKTKPFAIKFARSQKISNEVRNYKFIKDEIIGDFYADLKESVVFWDLGAILYTLVGLSSREWRNFREFYLNANERSDILRPLRHFFSEAWRSLYDKRDKLEISLFEAYDKALTFDKVLNLTQRLERFPEQGKLLNFPELSVSMINPISWVLRHKMNSFFPPDYPVNQAITHGDLHGDNLIVDDSHAWAIDFERSGWGHILRDFVELEMDIVSRLVPSDVSLLELLGLSIALADPKKSGDRYRLVDKCVTGEQSKKAYDVILGLREIAQQQTGFTDYREYYWGLLLDAVFVATLTPDDTQRSNTPHSEDIQRKRALIYGAVLCSRLENWNKKWPTEDLRKMFGEMRKATDIDKLSNKKVIYA